MKALVLSSFVVLLTFVACGGRYVDLEVDEDNVSSGGSTDSSGGTVNASGGATSGGMTSGGNPTGSGGKQHQGPIGGEGPTELTRGGFGDAMATFHDGKPDMGSFDEACKGRGEPFFIYNADECLAASACLSDCDPTDAASTMIVYSPKGGSEEPVAVVAECRTVTASNSKRAGESFYVFPCDENSACPNDLVCVESDLGPACFVKEVPWVAGCTDAYCIQGEGPPPAGGEGPPAAREYCSEEIPCCAGHVCSSEGTCERLECSGPGYLCDDSSPGATCCAGLTCTDGKCAP
jgi:hypothetical protein